MFYNEGIQVIPVPYGTKACTIDFNKYLVNRQTESDIDRMFRDDIDLNIGWASGERSSNLLTFDFDTTEAYSLAQSVSEPFKDLCNRTTVTKTPRGFHVHVRIKKPAGVHTSKLTYGSGTIGDLKFSGYTLEPDSVFFKNDQRLYYTFADRFRGIAEVESIEALGMGAFLTSVPMEQQNTSKFAVNVPIHLEKKSSRDLIFRYGDKYKRILEGNLEGYQSRSEAENAFILRGIILGQTEEEIWSLFEAFGNHNKLKYLQKGSHRFHDEYMRTYTYWMAEISKSGTLNIDLASCYKALDQNMPAGKKKVIMGVLSILKSTGLDKLHRLSLSLREVAIAGGVCLSTAHIYLPQIGIECIKEAQNGKAGIYDVSNLKYLLEQSSTDVGPSTVEDCISIESKNQIYTIDPGSDISRTRALGANANIILSSLVFRTEKTIGEWGALWKDRYMVAKRKLELLALVGIVKESYTIKRGKGALTYAAVGDVTTDRITAICEAAETYGARAKQRKLYQAERDYFQYKQGIQKSQQGNTSSQELPEYTSFKEFAERFKIKDDGNSSASWV